jgi:hypothetical protein
MAYMKRKKFLLVLLSLWFFIALFSVGYNTINSFFEIKNWSFLTDAQKRHRIFGDLYDFFVFVNVHTADKREILIFSKDVRTHYFGMYMLYPKIMTDTNSEENLIKIAKQATFPYIGTYDYRLHLDTYQEIASFSSPTTHDFGVLYKRK